MPASARADPSPLDPGAAASTTAPDPPAPDRVERILDVAAAAVALLFLALIAAQAGAARFFTDECFHAHVARWIAAHGTLPRVIPELYSGYAYSYPPLFHLVSAAAVRLAGVGALPWVNPALTALLLAVVVVAPPRGVDRSARRWALLICVGNAALATYALRFYAETLVVLLAAAASALFLRLRAGGVAVAAGLGIVVGLAITAKTSALALLLALAGAGLLARARGRSPEAGRAALAVGIALLVATPFLLRNQLLFGSALYPAFAPDLDRALYRLHLERFGLATGAFYALAVGTLGPALLLGLAGLGSWIARRRAEPAAGHTGAAAGLVLFALVALAAAPALPVHEPRHLLPLLPILALGGAVALASALPVRMRRWVDVALLAVVPIGLAVVPGLRARLDPPAPLRPAYAAVAAHVPEGGRVLSLWTYDTFYWSGRAATWPVPWGQADRPLEPLLARDAATLVAALDRHGIDAVLAPRHSNVERFDGSNYPRAFVSALAAGVEQGTLEVVWSNEGLALVVRRR